MSSVSAFSDNIFNTLFSSELGFLFFNSFRKMRQNDISALENRLSQVLYLLKIKIRAPGGDAWLSYLKLFFSLLAHVRDPRHGKGEHDIAYMMIRVWYNFFPSLACFFVYSMVSDDFGSWRDIKYLCRDVYLHAHKNLGKFSGGSREPDKHAIIVFCVKLMNKQLKRDIDAAAGDGISNVAKWIPREKSNKFGWLFSVLVFDFFRSFFPRLLPVEPNVAAVTRCKMMYRKYVSRLNAVLDTPQIKMCARNVDAIDPCRVSKFTFMKQPQLAETFSTQLLAPRAGADSGGVVNLPISYFIKTAFALVEGGGDVARCSLLNKQWAMFSKYMSRIIPRSHFIPCVDVSASMRAFDSESFFAGIGLAILFCQRSFFGKRFLAADHCPSWVVIGDDVSDLVDIVRIIHGVIEHASSTRFDIRKSVDFIATSFLSANLSARDVCAIRLVVFSDFSGGSCYDTIKTRFARLGYDETSVILWNLSKTGIVSLPCSVTEPRLVFMSGISAEAYSDYGDNPFQNIVGILNGKRYQRFHAFVDSVAG
jgi:hypothetical protein